MGRIQSILDNLDEQDRISKFGLSVVINYFKFFQSFIKKFQDLLDEVGGILSEFRFRRFGSFRKGERLSGVFKLVVGVLMSKVNEIKQIIFIFVKYGFFQFLGRFSDNLDVDEKRGRDMSGRFLDYYRKYRNSFEEFDNLYFYFNSKFCIVILFMICFFFIVYMGFINIC